MRTHTAPKKFQPFANIVLAHYEMNGLPDESIDCIHCGTWGDAFDGSDNWPLAYSDFAKIHERSAKRMRREGITNYEPHLQLAGFISHRKTTLHVCPMCGWWVAVDRAILPAVGSQFWLMTMVCNSILFELDPTDIELPIDEVRRFLRRRYDQRHSLNPRLFEETVASVFRDLGYRSEVTAYSNDGGIDVILHGSDSEKIGVQVKRQKRSVEVEQIRALLGALTLGGYSKGMFVSTSNYQRGAIQAAAQCDQLKIPIELFDSSRFFDMLGIAQLNGGVDPEACGFYQTKNPKFVAYDHLNLNSL